MPSIVQLALGPDFSRLHPRLQEQYGFTNADALAFRARGVMERIWRGGPHVVPFLHLGAMRRAVFPDTGRSIPFTVANYAYTDRFGRETLTWTRTFEFPRPRRFDETLIHSNKRGQAVVYMGSHQHLAVDLHLSAHDGALLIRTGSQRFYEWPIAIPFPILLSGVATARESYSDDRARFEIDVRIANPLFGRILGYNGWFTGGCEPCPPGDIPSDCRPAREERRE